MPSYDYYCSLNGQTVEVKHRISEKLLTWGELCEKAGISLGDTPSNSPIERKITSSQVVNAAVLKNPEPTCGSGCSRGFCGR